MKKIRKKSVKTVKKSPKTLQSVKETVIKLPKDVDSAYTFNPKSLKSELKADAKALKIPMGSAEIFIDRVVAEVEKSFGEKKILTKKDLDRAVYRELKKYHPDFAYVYKNRDIII